MKIIQKIACNLIKISFLLITIFSINQCAEMINILNQANIQKPVVNLSDVKMTGLSFDSVDLLFHIDIDNPNNVGIKLAGFDYDLQIEDNSFINGKQDNGLAIKANGSEIIKLPLTLKFKDIYNTFSIVKDLDSVQYKLNSGLSFNLPVLGDIRIPVTKSGNIPTLKLPSINFKKLKMDQIKLTGADLTLQINIDNHNAFAFILKNIDYKLNVAGTQWIDGKMNQSMNISAKQENIINIPISLNFLSMGQSVYNIVNGNQSLNYSLKGNADMGSSLPLLGDFNIPFNQTGNTNIDK
jgi:LEA14-like dessication related protein